MRQGKRLAISPPVFLTSAGALVALIAFAIVDTPRASALFADVLDGVTSSFGWLYVSAVAFYVAFTVWILFSRAGELRLGGDDEKPEFSTVSWFAMLFSAGMGIGLVFYGVAEPMLHYRSPPNVDGQTAEAARMALPITFFHWGIHAWAIYALMALAIAFFAYRKGLPFALRSCFHPLLGDRVHGWLGHGIDILAVLGTLFGLATSLGLGAMQISAGLARLFGVPHSMSTQLIIIGVVTAVATISLVTGIKRGIRRLSELNLGLATLLMLFVFLVGPTTFIIHSLVEGVGGYVEAIFTRTLRIGVFSAAEEKWSKAWTLFYWGWWIAWAPFVGMFIARISRGRRIREFVLGVLLVPTAVGVVWFSVFGGTALHLERATGVIGDAVAADVSTALYVLLEQLPLTGVTSILAAVVVAVFFVTSSDSASFVVDMLASGGEPNPPVWQRVFWATAEGACAAVLLYAGGKKALTALQAASVSAGLPFCILLLVMAYCLAAALRQELRSKLVDRD